MINSISIALSGLSAATKKVNESATNIANQQNGVDLAQEAVNLKIAEVEYKANVAVIKVAEDLSDELLRTFDKKV